MNYKLEYKYLVPIKHLDALRKDIKPYLEYDPYADMQPKKEYSVRSIYLDTNTFKCYHEKIEGLKNRKKYRIRGYNNGEGESIVFLEIKSKADRYVSKDRVKLPYRNLMDVFKSGELKDKILNGNGKDNKKTESTEKFLYHYYINRLQPAVLVIYEREAYHSKFNSRLRITFDKNLRSSVSTSLHNLFLDENIKYSLPGYFILEVKFYESLPEWVSRITTKYNLQRQSISKYTISVDTQKESIKSVRPCFLIN